MFYKIIASIITLSLLSGCSSVAYHGLDRNIKPVDYPEIGIVTVASLGEHLLEKGQLSTEKRLLLEKSIQGKIWNLKAGEYRALGKKDDKLYFVAHGNVFHSMGGAAEAVSVANNGNASEICVHVPMGKTHCYQANFLIIDKEIESQSDFIQTLIYNGKIGNKINISYREFYSGNARPAFYSEVEYDLETSNEIGYKKALIEVLEADNRKIKYKAIRSF